LNEIHVGVVKPVKVIALNLEGEEFMLIDAAVLDLIHSIELSLEQNELASSG
jgi:hypothetical protein